MLMTARARRRLRWYRRWRRLHRWIHGNPVRWEYDWVRGGRFLIEVLSDRPHDVRAFGRSFPVPGHPTHKRIAVPESRFYDGLVLEYQCEPGRRWRCRYLRVDRPGLPARQSPWEVVAEWMR
jgi:hypothetical protein